MGLFADSCHPILEAYFRQPRSKDYDWEYLRAKANEAIEELKAEAKANGEKEDSWIYLMLLPAILNFRDPLILRYFSAIIHYVGKGKEGRWVDHLKLEMQLISYFLRHVKYSGGEVVALAMGKMYDALSVLLEYSTMELYRKPGTSEYTLLANEFPELGGRNSLCKDFVNLLKKDMGAVEAANLFTSIGLFHVVVPFYESDHKRWTFQLFAPRWTEQYLPNRVNRPMRTIANAPVLNDQTKLRYKEQMREDGLRLAAERLQKILLNKTDPDYLPTALGQLAVTSGAGQQGQRPGLRSGGGLAVETVEIQLTHTFEGSSIAEVYTELLVSGNSSGPSGAFSYRQRGITLRLTSRVENQRVNAEFRLRSYSPKEHFASASFTLAEKLNGTELAMTATGVPSEKELETRDLLKRLFFRNIEKSLA